MSPERYSEAAVYRTRPLDPATTGPAGLRTVLRIAKEWDLSAREFAVLLGVSERTAYRWRRSPERARISDALLLRLSYLLGIYEALVNLAPDARQRGLFMRRPKTDPVCKGESPIGVVEADGLDELRTIRQWLDGQAQW